MIEEQNVADETNQNLVSGQNSLFHADTLQHLKKEQQQWEETAVKQAQKRLPEREHLGRHPAFPFSASIRL